MKLEVTVLHEISHRMINTALFHLSDISKIVKLREKDSKMVVTRNREEGKWGVAVHQYKVLGENDEEFLGISCTTAR